MAILNELAQMTFGWGETVILPHSTRLHGYKLSSNHPFIQLLDGKYQLLVEAPDDDAVFERVFHTTHFFVTNFFVISRCKETNVFDKPKAEGKSRSVCTMPRRENVCCEETNMCA